MKRVPRVKIVNAEAFKNGFVSPNVPFPLNPYFKPDPPLSNDLRSSIFKLFESHPKRWYFHVKVRNIYELSVRYGLSMDRITAILRLKALEKQMIEAGKPLQKGLNAGMEKLLHSVNIEVVGESAPRMEPLGNPSISNETQPSLFTLVDESDTFNFTDVSTLLMREPFANKVYRLNAKAMSAYEPVPPKDTRSQKFEPPNPRLASKSAFLFKDTSKDETVVRERDGSLRALNRVEKWKLKHSKPMDFVNL